MTLIYVLLAVAAALLCYQLFFNKDPDRLDSNGNPVMKKKKQQPNS